MDENYRRIGITNIQLTIANQLLQNKDAQAKIKEESFLMHNATVKIGILNSKSVKLMNIVAGHNRTISIDANGKTFTVTYNGDIETLHTAILNQCGKLGSRSTREKATPPLASTNSLAIELSDLVVYCKAKPGGVNMTNIKQSLRYAELQKNELFGLKEMFGKPDNSLDYSDITSINDETLAKL